MLDPWTGPVPVQRAPRWSHKSRTILARKVIVMKSDMKATMLNSIQASMSMDGEPNEEN